MLEFKQYDELLTTDNSYGTNVIRDIDPASHLSIEDFQKHINKPIRGFGVISDMEGNQVSEPNLVVLGGREYAAHMLAQKSGPVNYPSVQSMVNLLDFKIRYFGIGKGAQEECNNDNIGVTYSNEVGLVDPIKIGEGNVGSDGGYKYIHDGYLKRIEADSGTIEVLEEDHTISIGEASNITVQANTSVKFTMYIQPSELNVYPETFNEAALYSVEMQDEIPKGLNDTDRFYASKRMFAKFTTLNKYLAASDGLKIEWYILT